MGSIIIEFLTMYLIESSIKLVVTAAVVPFRQVALWLATTVTATIKTLATILPSPPIAART